MKLNCLEVEKLKNGAYLLIKGIEPEYWSDIRNLCGYDCEKIADMISDGEYKSVWRINWDGVNETDCTKYYLVA